MCAMKGSGAWKWMLGLAAAVLAAKTSVIEAVFSVLLLLALASAILFSLALFSMDFVEATAWGLEFLEGAFATPLIAPATFSPIVFIMCRPARIRGKVFSFCCR